MKQQGIFISLEGGEGAGKSSQAKRLCECLTSHGYDPLLTREPGGCPEAEAVRSLLVGGAWQWDGLSEAMLISAARRQHWMTVIAPAIAAGRVVISDRFSDSTTAYQGAGRGVPLEILEQLLIMATNGARPNLTLLFDLPVEIGLARAANRDREKANNETRFERESIAFHQRLRDGFLAIATTEPERVKIIDATMNEDEIAKKVLEFVAQHGLPSLGGVAMPPLRGFTP